MRKMQISKCEIDGIYIIEPVVFRDERGYFMETYNLQAMKEAGLDIPFVQDNQSLSRKGVLRGLHYQIKHPQGKLMRVISGSVYDAVVDLRMEGPTYGKAYGMILSEENQLQLYIPPGFAHGFLVLSDIAVIAYKVTDFYHPNDEGGLAWNDPDIAVQWPIGQLDGAELILSDKDQKNPTLQELTDNKA